jgi:hypothetical protein
MAEQALSACRAFDEGIHCYGRPDIQAGSGIQTAANA